jgi:antitoxin MazE
MVKRLTKTDDSLSLVLDPPLLEAARIDADTPLEISTDGDVIVITPVRDGKRAAKFKAGVEAINERYAGVFRRLAE